MRQFSKSWRKLDLGNKTKILQEKYNLDISEIERIRKITNPKKKLVQAATLQFESFGNIHNDITSWIAGFRSDAAVRQHLGSSLALRRMVMPPQEDFSDIGVSWNDIRNRIRIPRSMSNDLAEEIGIHIGDGNLSMAAHKGWDSYKYRIDGCLKDEFIYHDGFLKDLMKKLYNCSPYLRKTFSRNSIQSSYSSKLLVKYKSEVLGLPVGSKKEIEIPNAVCEDDSFAIRCLVGIMDTDFSYTQSGSIVGKLTSLNVISQMISILERLRIKFISRIFDTFGEIRIQPGDSFHVIEDWEFHNEKHVSKHHLLKETGEYIPFTHTEERLAVLDGRLSIDALEKISKLRKSAVVKKALRRD